MLAIPVLALLGVFNTKTAQASITNGGVILSASYPTQILYHSNSRLEISVENSGSAGLSNLTLQVEADYFNHFSFIMTKPAPTTVQDGFYIFPLADLAPGAKNAMISEFQGDEYGRSAGKVRVLSGGQILAQLDISTTSLP